MLEDAEPVRHLRRFNRLYTERLGLLSEHFHDRPRSLGASRLLWEIGEGCTDVRALRKRLALDSGYVSRLLRALESEGLIDVRVKADDTRTKEALLTAHGGEEVAVLDSLSDEGARSVLERLDPPDRDELIAALNTAERLLTRSLVSVEPVDPESTEARSCVHEYFAELHERFPGGFDPGQSLPADADDLRPPRGVMLVAFLHGEAVGCGALKLHGDEPAEIKRMWVSPISRGLGVGRLLLRSLERHALDAGARVANLETNRALVEAISMYRREGYEEVPAFNDDPYAHHWFTKRLDQRGA